MLSYCLKCRKNTENKNPEVARTKNRKIKHYQNVRRVIVKKQNLSNSKKLVNY